jgi:hypothetical protein
MLVSGVGGGDTVFHVLSRDSDTQVTVQETASETLSNEAWSIERAFNHFWTWKGDRNGDLVTEKGREVGVWCESQQTRWDNMLVSGVGGGDTVFHVLTRDSDTQVTSPAWWTTSSNSRTRTR